MKSRLPLFSAKITQQDLDMQISVEHEEEKGEGGKTKIGEPEAEAIEKCIQKSNLEQQLMNSVWAGCIVVGQFASLPVKQADSRSASELVYLFVRTVWVLFQFQVRSWQVNHQLSCWI